MKNTQQIRNTFERGEGVLELMPAFIPRNFAKPGFRLRLHPDDYYAFGMSRGAIKERWLSSTTAAMNGPEMLPDEGMSYVKDGNSRFLFKHSVEELGAGLIGETLQKKYGTFPIFAKFFDYNTPLFHHLHMKDEKAALVGRLGKPEAYYFPRQLNNHLGEFPITYFGFDPDTSKESIKQCIRDYLKRDTRITQFSRAYRAELGTGWYTPPGVIHAPASVLTYEPQWNSDINTIMENVTSGEVNGIEQLTGNCPPEKREDIEFLFDLIDWEASTDPHYRKKYYREPVPLKKTQDGCTEKWIAYNNEYIGAKEVTVEPGAKIVLKDSFCYGCVLIQGFGKFGIYPCETAVMLRFGQPSADEFFVSESAASQGVIVENHSVCEPLVILQHFACNIPQLEI